MKHEKLSHAVREMSATDAKAHFADLLDAVEGGQTVVITRHGKAVARLAPETDGRREAIAHFSAKLDAFRKTGPRLSIAEIRSAIREGRK
jgi:prevent-host-death family protein